MGGPRETPVVHGSEFLFEDVSVELRGREVLHGVTTSIADHGVTVVLGPSGSGKSTLLRLCNRLVVPSAGRVRRQGVDIDAIDPLELRRKVAMVFQRPTPFPGTVAENLLAAVPDAPDTDLRALLDRVGLDSGYLERPASELSGGEAQRMCLARSLSVSPEVLLMDEPTSALDEASSAVIEDLARECSAAGTPVAWVTHDLSQAERLAHRIVVLIDGRVASQDEADRFRRGVRGGSDVDPDIGGRRDTSTEEGD